MVLARTGCQALIGPIAHLSPSTQVAYSVCMVGTPEDSALMLRYRDGDVAAFGILYERHNDSLFRYLLRLSGHHDTAEDLYQEVWSKIIKSRSRYRPTAKFTTFLYRVAHNCFIDHIRRNKRHTNEVSIDPDDSASPMEEPEDGAERSIAREKLNQALGELPTEQRDVVLLFLEAGLSVDKIASVTGVNRETAKSRLRYATAKLKAALADIQVDAYPKPGPRGG
jgi:RNA polymerase sigma-70 factor (ECF subfamily)